MSSARLLRLTFPLIRTHGFTREALSRSVLSLPDSQAHPEPLSDSAVSALFGNGDLARRRLINAWLDEGINSMSLHPQATESLTTPTVKDALHTRLAYNEPVLHHLPEAFALLASPGNGLPPLDPLPALKHAAKIADEACYLARDPSLELSWYARRASLAAMYSAAELHQMTSPNTAHSFLDQLLETSTSAKNALDEIGLYSDYIFKSWKGIIRSSGIV